MASEQGRGAQVRLDGEARQIARGGAGLRLIDSIVQKAALEAAGTVADGNRADGSTVTGTAADDEVLLPGGEGASATFTASGTGAVERTVQAKLGEVVSVKDFGALGDGVTDDAAAINAAITYLAGLPLRAGEVRFPEGLYIVNSPINLPNGGGGVYSNITLAGPGRGAAEIRAGAAMAAVILGSSTWNRGHCVRDMTVNGRTLATRTIHWRAGSQFRIERCWVLNGTEGNVRLDGGENFISGCLLWSQDTVFTTVGALPSYNLQVNSADNQFVDNVLFNAKDANIQDTVGSDNLYTGNHAYHYSTALGANNFGTYNFDTAGGRWIGNSADSCITAGFNLTGFGHQIIGNRIFWGTGWTASIGIRLAAGLQSALVAHNFITGATTTNAVVQLPSPGVNTVVRDNVGSIYGKGAKVLSSYGSTIGANILGYLGDFGNVQGTNAFAIGEGVNDQFRKGAFTRASGNNGWTGDAQVYDVVFHGKGISGTVNITPDGSVAIFSGQIIRLRTDIPTHALVSIRLVATASNGETASWTVEFSMRAASSAASTVFVDAAGADTTPTYTKVSGTSGTSGWTPAIVKDTTNGGCYLTGTGSTSGGKTIYWTADIHVVEVAAGTN
jgi:hypothetical protein